jgi:hypothetical protein
MERFSSGAEPAQAAVASRLDFLGRAEDGTLLKRQTCRQGQDQAEVVPIEIEGGGPTWPGRRPPGGFIGKSTLGISANELIWEFFQQNSMKCSKGDLLCEHDASADCHTTDRSPRSHRRRCRVSVPGDRPKTERVPLVVESGGRSEGQISRDMAAESEASSSWSKDASRGAFSSQSWACPRVDEGRGSPTPSHRAALSGRHTIGVVAKARMRGVEQVDG